MHRQELQQSVSDTDQRNFIKIGVLLNQSAANIRKDLVKALGKSAYSLRTVQVWVKKCHAGRINTSESRGGAHNVAAKQKERIAEVRDLLEQQKDWTVAEMSRLLLMPTATVHRILTEHLHMRNLLSRWVPESPAEDVIEKRCNAVSRTLSLLTQQHPLYLRQTLAVDETWVFLCRDQSSFGVAVEEEPPRIPAMQKVDNKRMLIAAIDFDGVAAWHLYDGRECVTEERYLQFLVDAMQDFKTEKDTSNVLLLHDDTKPHNGRIVSEFLKRNNILTWHQPPCSPDISPPNYGCFHALKCTLSGYPIPNWPDFCATLEVEIQAGNVGGVFQGLRKLGKRWRAVFQQQGQYL